jgi:CHASE2 domain-containing sensor protein/tRNA A-37 threonylcarbamoyl transferase component Bud32
MGEVWKAENVRLKKIVAIKTLSPQLLADEEAKARFLREARLAAKLNHPNIATVYDVEETEDLIFIVMEYIEGESLDKRIKRGPMERREVVRIITEVGDALAEAHKHRIIHRDIKPQNIMITEAGRVKVLDFGLAKLLPTPQLADTPDTATVEATALTMPGVTFGTRKYMSPEQWMSPDVDERSDIFSFGVVMFEMLVGDLPVEGYQLSGMIHAQSAMWSGVFHSVPQEFQPIIVKALSKNRNERYQSVSELLRDVDGLSGLPVGAPQEAATIPLGVEKGIAEREAPTLPLVAEPEVKPTPKLVPTLVHAAVALVPSLGLIYLGGKKPETEPMSEAVLVGLSLVLPFAIYWIEKLAARKVKPLKTVVEKTDARVPSFTFITMLVVLAAAANVQDFLGWQGWGDWRYTQSPATPSQEIVLIGIDDKSRQKFLDSGDQGAKDLSYWRKYHSRVIETILKYGPPQAIGFDLYFEDATEFDTEFAASIAKARERGIPVIVGEYFKKPDYEFRPTTPKIKEAVTDVFGHPVVLQDREDGLVRWLPLVLNEKGPSTELGITPIIGEHASIALLMLNKGQYDGTSVKPGREIKLRDGRIVPLQKAPPSVESLPGERFDLETIPINYARQRFERLSYHDVFEGSIFNSGLPQNYFAGKYVLIGVAYDKFEAPLPVPQGGKRADVYGFEIHASAMSTILQNAYIRRIQGLTVWVVIALVSLTVFVCGIRFGSRLKVMLPILIGVGVVLWGVSYGLSYSYRWFDASYAIFGAITIAAFVRLTSGRLK